MSTKIEWAKHDLYQGETWNPTKGCTPVSPGCKNCYALRMALRQVGMGTPGYEGTVKDGHWSGRVNCVEAALDIPGRWRKPRRVFVGSMSDLFHENVSDGFIAKVRGVMRSNLQHQFLLLTKRAWRMSRCSFQVMLGNVAVGVSVEDQARADQRIPHLVDTPAPLHFISYEPALGPVQWQNWLKPCCNIDALICGGESGPGARPMDPDWARAARDACEAAGVAFFFKQWGGVHKAKTGRVLDGRVHDDFLPWHRHNDEGDEA